MIDILLIWHVPYTHSPKSTLVFLFYELIVVYESYVLITFKT